MTVTKRRMALTLAGVSVVLSAFAVAAPANAATSAPSAASSENCGVFVETGETICVPVGEDLHAAVEEETGRTIVDAKADGTVARAAASDPVARSSYLLGRLYDGADYGGSYKEFYGLNAGCGGGNNFSFSDIGSDWWYRVSSFRGYSNCSVKVWENTGFTGASLGYYSAQSYVGSALNDKIRSVKFQ